MSALLEKAIERIKAGDKATGINLLKQEITQNPRNENAWLWMSYCVSEVNQKKYCFEQALAINPNNEAARKELEKLSSRITPLVSTVKSSSNAPSSIKQVDPNTSPIKELPTSKVFQSPTSLSSQQPKKIQHGVNKGSASKSVRSPKKKGISPAILAPIIVALIGLCGTAITVVLNPDLISTIIEIVAPRPDNFTISVHVADKSGSTVSGVKVLFFYPAGSLSQYTDSNGVSTFNVSNVGQGNLRVIVESDEYQIFEKQVVYPIETTIDVRLSEKQGSNENVILRAVTDGGNAPITGVEVIVSLDGKLYRQTTDSDGFALFELPFPDEGKVDTQISVNAQGYGIENQFSTLTPGKLQYILLTPNSLRIEVPDIPVYASTTVTLPTSEPVEVVGGVIGTGVEVSQLTGGSGLKIIALTPDSTPWNDAYFEVFEQKTDVTGSPSQGERVGGGRINLQGELSFNLEDGIYSVCPPELGYGWTDNGCVYDVQVATGSQTIVELQSGKIEVSIVDASGNPWSDVYAQIYTQKQNAVGEPVTAGNSVWSGRTDNTGSLNAWLTPGLYAVKIDLRGYNWGDLADAYGKANVSVNKGATTSVVVKMGQVMIGLNNLSGEPRQDTYMSIYTQKKDVNGNPVLNNRVWDGYTDNGGLATISLTEGMYALSIDNEVLYNIPVNWGVITQTDGKTYQQNK